MINKDSKKNELLKRTFINFVVKIIIWTICIPTFFLVTAEIVSRLDFQWLYNISHSYYYNVKGIFDFLFDVDMMLFMILLVWVIGTLIFLYKLLKKVFSYTEAVFNASSKLLDKDTDYIELPSELEELEKQMNHLKYEAEKNERLAKESEKRKNDLVVYLAHDLKTPLTSMIGYLSLIDEIKDMPKKQREKYVGIALEKSYKLEDLINELFDITRFNAETIVLEKEDINLNMMLEQIIDDFYPTLKEMGKTISYKPTRSIMILGDSDKLYRVFNNLFKNAINYSTDKVINIDVVEKEKEVTVIVSNKGKKIPPEKLNRLFEKFYRADSARTSKTGGSGLGLAIAKEIVELHGGKITASSDDDYTRFYVTLLRD